MHISNLFVFAKDRDSTEVHRGYKYQDLKALETWLANKLNKIDETIYCDYEEDLFQRSLKDYNATFRQFKLYSSKTFSFSSVEIKKAIPHFFTLYVKGEYLFDSPTFHFETNTAISRQYGTNDADLLKEWADNQGKLNGQLLEKCTVNTKDIISQYFTERIKETKGESDKQRLIDAYAEFEKLDNEFWEGFVNRIKWTFKSVSAEEELNNTIESINSLIKKIQFPTDGEDADKIFSALYREVSMRSIMSNPEDRGLTLTLMDHVVLNLGDKYDKQYSAAVHKWQNEKTINRFRIGEFYEVLHAAKYCRRKNYLEDHSSQWIGLLSSYINTLGIPEKCKREAIYEIVWVTVRPTLKIEELKIRDAKGTEVLIRDYFANFDKFDSVQDLHDSLTLLTVIFTVVKFEQVEIEQAEIEGWIDRYTTFINSKISTETNPYILCHLHENNAFLKLNKVTWKTENTTLREAIVEFEKIIPLLDKAEQYSVYDLYEKLESTLQLYTTLGKDEPRELLSTFLEKLEPYAESRQSNFNRAKKFTNRGIDLLKTSNKKGILRAISYFHLAKVLYYEDRSMEGYVLALLNISQFYLAVGLNFAAKYYALSAIMVCLNQNDSILYKRISKGYAFVFLADFQEGAWINALYSLQAYAATAKEFTTSDFSWGVAEEEMKQAFFSVSMIIGITPILAPELKHLIDFHKKQLNFFGSVFEEANTTVFQTMTESEAAKVLGGKVRGLVFNDVGKTRTVVWKALGIEWSVVFQNNFVDNSIGEEFCALLQVSHAELALNFEKLPYKDVKLYIKIINATHLRPPEVTVDKNRYMVNLCIGELKNPKIKDVNFHYAGMSNSIRMILSEVVSLTEGELNKIWTDLHKTHDLGEKGLTLASYQNSYRELISDTSFKESQQDSFSQPSVKAELHEDPALSKSTNS